MCSSFLIGWWQPTINFIFYFHILFHHFIWKNLLCIRQWLKTDTRFREQISMRFSKGIFFLQPCLQCASRNTIFFSNLSLSFHFFCQLCQELATLCQEIRLLTIVIFDYWWLCCSGRIPRLSLIRHSLYVGVVEKPPPPPLAGEQYGKMEPKYPEGGRCQSVLCPWFFLTSPFMLNNSVETAAPFNVVNHPRWCEPRY